MKWWTLSWRHTYAWLLHKSLVAEQQRLEIQAMNTVQLIGHLGKCCRSNIALTIKRYCLRYAQHTQRPHLWFCRCYSDKTHLWGEVVGKVVNYFPSFVTSSWFMDLFSYNLCKFQVGNYCWSACLKHCNLYGDHSLSLCLNSNSASGILTLVWKLHIILVRLYSENIDPIWSASWKKGSL